MNKYDKIEAFCIGVIWAAIAYAVFMTAGCTTLTPTQKWERDTIANQNWVNCETALKENGVVWIARHSHQSHRPHRIHEIHEDLIDAQCRRRLGRYWITQ